MLLDGYVSAEDLRRKSASKSIFESPWDDSLKYRQLATRQQSTKVRSDNVATAQVRHYIPNRGREFSCPMQRPEKAKQSPSVLLVTCRGKKPHREYKGGPLPSRNSNQTLETMEAK